MWHYPTSTDGKKKKKIKISIKAPVIFFYRNWQAYCIKFTCKCKGSRTAKSNSENRTKAEDISWPTSVLSLKLQWSNNAVGITQANRSVKYITESRNKSKWSIDLFIQCVKCRVLKCLSLQQTPQEQLDTYLTK